MDYVQAVRAGLLAVVAIGLGASSAAAQMDGCEFGERGRNDGNFRTIPQVGPIWYIGGPHFVCADGVEIFADSAVSYENRGLQHLIGRVRYLAPGRELRADEARYFQPQGRLQATGNVSLIDSEAGSTIEHGDLVLLLVTDFRDEETMTVTTGDDGVRPVALLAPPTGEVEPLEADEIEEEEAPGEEEAQELPLAPQSPPEPYTVVSDRMFLRGAGYFAAAGTVEIVQDSLLAFADSMEYDQEAGDLRLVGEARLESDAYELEGQTITMGTPGAQDSEVRAIRDARLIGDDLELTSAQILMFLRDDALERLVATTLAGSGDATPDSLDLERPEAFVQDFRLTADSLEVLAPSQTIERVLAAGTARSVSTSGDSLNVEVLPEVARTDWLEGDTIIVTFAPVSDLDDGEMDVQEIVAIASARSLYRLPPNDSTAEVGIDPPAVHYVTGDQIRIEMDGGEVSRMQVMGQTRGVHLEPLRGAAAPDSTVVPPDTSIVLPDTAQADAILADTVRTDTLSVTVGESAAHELSAPRHEERPEPVRDNTPSPEEVPWTRQ